MGPRPFFSLIVPTRRRPGPLGRFLDSVAATVSRPDDVEIILVTDADDPDSRTVGHAALHLRHVVVPPGLTMGSLNAAGYEASAGAHVMLLNDDVVVRGRGWDARVRGCLRRFPDDIVLVHVNDTLFRRRLCTFPLVSRTFCRLAGGICPREYARYRIDDHIEDVFNMLAALGRRRTLYFPDLVFEHHNTVERPQGDQVYASDPAVLAGDDARFADFAAARKELVLRLLDHIDGEADAAVTAARREKLARLNDPFYLRLPGRQRVEWSAWLRWAAGRLRPAELAHWAAAFGARARAYVGRKGYGGFLGALGRRVTRLGAGGVREADLRRLAHEARYPADG
jgi:hypothetical protein